ncbi:MAG TPA: hypothetical protein VFY10_07680, partial [Dehalococcoidia bacterium]|nr:hypothetical protein [Dehalococcoidia bacterium]
QFDPDNYGVIDAPPVGAEQWQSLGAGRALLMVHGTFSRAAGAFCALPRDFVQTLSTRYGGRLFALDHPTLSQDPKQNIEWFLNQVPDGTALDLDIVCHSRGGLVSRMLTEHIDRFALGNRRVNIGKVVFVAAPNAGTVLADPKHVGDFIDSYTNILNFFPDTMVLDTLQAILAVVKQIAVGALAGLDGLQSMVPGGTFLGDLNQARTSKATYYALASNFEPADKGLLDYAKDVLLDKLFAKDNDLIVPTEGVWDQNGGSLFPIAEHFVFTGSDAVQHNGYFGNAVAREKILGWLTPS